VKRVRAKFQASMGFSLATLLLVGCGVTGPNWFDQLANPNPAPGTVSVDTTSLDFGQQPVGSSHSKQTITVRNTGQTQVSLTSVSTDTNVFQWVGPTLPVSLGPSQSAQLGIYFKPDAESLLQGNLSIASNGSGSPSRVKLAGRGKTGGEYTTVTDSGVRLEPELPRWGRQGLGSRIPRSARGWCA